MSITSRCLLNQRMLCLLESRKPPPYKTDMCFSFHLTDSYSACPPEQTSRTCIALRPQRTAHIHFLPHHLHKQTNTSSIDAKSSTTRCGEAVSLPSSPDDPFEDQTKCHKPHLKTHDRRPPSQQPTTSPPTHHARSAYFPPSHSSFGYPTGRKMLFIRALTLVLSSPTTNINHQHDPQG